MHKIDNLKIWNRALELCKDVYELSKELPKTEEYGLRSQIKRCAISIPSNIAEGAGRNSTKEFVHFLSIANGSSYELQTQLILLSELNLIEKSKIEPVINRVVEIQKMNYVFQKYLSSRSK